MSATEPQDDQEREADEELTASSLGSRARRVVAWVALINLVGMVIEIAVGARIGSASLLADAADFLEDFLINALVVLALGWPVASRRRAARWLAALILIPALAALATAVWRLATGQPPEPISLSLTAGLALILNALCGASASLLTRGLGRRIDVFVGTGYSLAIGGVLLIVPGLLMGGRLPQTTAAAHCHQYTRLHTLQQTAHL